MVVLDAGNIVYKYEKDEMGEKLFSFLYICISQAAIDYGLFRPEVLLKTKHRKNSTINFKVRVIR